MSRVGHRGVPALSVVVPAHDAEATLGAQMDALLAQRWDEPFEVIVVDNGSTDGTGALVEAATARDPRVRLLRADGGQGPSYARNAGIRHARAPLVACCDADDVVAPGWIASMSGAVAKHDLVAGALEIDELNEPWVVAGRGRSIASGPGEFRGLAFAHGCNLGVRRDLFLAVGGFDERLTAGEEIDLAIRLKQRGVEAFYERRALVHYRYRTEWRSHWHQAFAYGRVKALLARRMRKAGVDTAGNGSWRGWLWLVRSLPRLGDRGVRMRWLWVAGSRFGEAVGRAWQRGTAS